VRRLDVAGGDRQRLQVAAQCDVDDEVEPREAGGGEHVLMDGVTVEDPGPRPGVAQVRERVVGEDTRLAGDRRKDGLPPAGEAGELVRLHLTEGDAQVCGRDKGVDEERSAGRRPAEVDEIGGPRVVAVHAESPCPLLAEEGADLGAVRRPVGAAADDDVDGVGAETGRPELGHHRPEKRLGRHGPGRVAGDYHGTTPPLRELAQGRRSDGMREGAGEGGGEVDVRRLGHAEPAHIAAHRPRPSLQCGDDGIQVLKTSHVHAS